MLLLWQSTVTKHPYYQPPDVVFVKPIEDDDDLFLAAWYLYMINWYKQENNND